jgi:hypothetical protein
VTLTVEAWMVVVTSKEQKIGSPANAALLTLQILCLSSHVIQQTQDLQHQQCRARETKKFSLFTRYHHHQRRQPLPLVVLLGKSVLSFVAEVSNAYLRIAVYFVNLSLPQIHRSSRYNPILIVTSDDIPPLS